MKRWEGEPQPSDKTVEEWRRRALAGEFSEVCIPLECYVGGADSCPRRNAAYAEACMTDLHLPSTPTSESVTAEHRAAYPDLETCEIAALAYLIQRKAPVMWREGTPQTTVVGFLHDMVMKGGPISLPPMVRRGEGADWIEEKVRKDYARGHLTTGSSAWGSPAFRVKTKGHKDRLVVDYRRVNALTERATFLMPSAEGVKTRVAGSQWFSTGDRVPGFNQIKNTPFAASVLAIVTMSGKHMPTSLGFGPRNGPEDFSKFGYRVFRRNCFAPGTSLWMMSALPRARQCATTQSQAQRSRDGLMAVRHLRSVWPSQPLEGSRPQEMRNRSLVSAIRLPLPCRTMQPKHLRSLVSALRLPLWDS